MDDLVMTSHTAWRMEWKEQKLSSLKEQLQRQLIGILKLVVVSRKAEMVKGLSGTVLNQMRECIIIRELLYVTFYINFRSLNLLPPESIYYANCRIQIHTAYIQHYVIYYLQLFHSSSWNKNMAS